MLAARGLISVALVFLVLPLAGCLGSDAAPDTDGIRTTGDKEVATGRPTESFTFSGAGLAPTGTITKEMQENPRSGPEGPILDQVFGERPAEWRFTVAVEGLIDLGAGDDGTKVGEVWYHLWVGVVDEDAEDGFKWEPAGTQPDPGVDGALQLETTWESDNKRFTAARLTLEARNDAIMEIPLLEFTDMPKEETGEWSLVDLKPFGGSFGDALVSAGAKETDVNITISGFDLPVEETDGEYDVFLANSNGNTYLGTLSDDAASSGLVLDVKLDEKELAGNWQIFVSLENGDEEKKDAADGITVLKSRF